jgi:hypothetical protein
MSMGITSEVGMRGTARRLFGFAMGLAALGRPLPSWAVACNSTELTYVEETVDDATSPAVCSGGSSFSGYCEQPTGTAPVYAFTTSGCDPLSGRPYWILWNGGRSDLT